MKLTVLDREAEIRPYRADDEPAFRRLHALVFGSDSEAKLRQWGWRYERNPAGPHRTMVCALDDGEVITSYSAIPLRGRVRGRPVDLAVAVDAMTHPAYRGAVLGRAGVYVRNFQAWVERFAHPHGTVQLGFGTPQVRAARLGQLLMGYEIWDGIGYWGRPLEDTWIKRIRRRLPDRRVTRAPPFGAEADALEQRLAGAYPSTVIRDARYLRWRYQESPQDYEVLALGGAAGEWDAWLVLRVDGDTASLVDALLPPDLPPAVGALFYRALGVALDRGATHMQAWAVRGSPIERLLLATGFAAGSYDGVRFAARLFDPTLGPGTLPDDWYFQPGDTDDL